MKNKSVILEWLFLGMMVGVISCFCIFRLHQLHFKIFIIAAYFVVLFVMIAFLFVYRKENKEIKHEEMSVPVSRHVSMKGGDNS